MNLQWNKPAPPAAATVTAKRQSTDADDIKNLFRKFDAEPGQYQEIVKDQRAGVAEARWPMLARLSIAQAAAAPAVQPAAFLPKATQVTRADAPVASAANSLAAVFQRLAGKPVVAVAPETRSLFKRFRVP